MAKSKTGGGGAAAILDVDFVTCNDRNVAF